MVIKYGCTEIEKFTELKKSELLLFPSLFEGFGLPPLEASYCRTKTVAFDLPVLREFHGDSLFFAEHNDYNSFKDKICEALDCTTSKTDLSYSENLATFDSFCLRLQSLIDKIIKEKQYKSISLLYLKFFNNIVYCLDVFDHSFTKLISYTDKFLYGLNYSRVLIGKFSQQLRTLMRLLLR